MKNPGKAPKQAKTPKLPKGNDEGGRYVERNIAKLNDGGECCVPTPAEPVNLHKRMAGAC